MNAAEIYDDIKEWAKAAVYDGCAVHKDCRGIYWAENWEGRSCGEFNPTTNTGFLKYT